MCIRDRLSADGISPRPALAMKKVWRAAERAPRRDGGGAGVDVAARWKSRRACSASRVRISSGRLVDFAATPAPESDAVFAREPAAPVAGSLCSGSPSRCAGPGGGGVPSRWLDPRDDKSVPDVRGGDAAGAPPVPAPGPPRPGPPPGRPDDDGGGADGRAGPDPEAARAGPAMRWAPPPAAAPTRPAPARAPAPPTASAPVRAAPAPSCLLYTSPSPRDRTRSRMPSSA